MNRTFGTIVLMIATAFCLLTAISSGLAPKDFAERLGFTIASADGYNEIRAQYMGFFLMIAAVSVAALVGVVSRRSVFLLLAVVFGGLIFGRIASLVLNRGFAGYGPTILSLYGIDCIGLVLSLSALSMDKPS